MKQMRKLFYLVAGAVVLVGWGCNGDRAILSSVEKDVGSEERYSRQDALDMIRSSEETLSEV